MVLSHIRPMAVVFIGLLLPFANIGMSMLRPANTKSTKAVRLCPMRLRLDAYTKASFDINAVCIQEPDSRADHFELLLTASMLLALSSVAIIPAMVSRVLLSAACHFHWQSNRSEGTSSAVMPPGAGKQQEG